MIKLTPPTKPPKTLKEYAREIVRYGPDISSFNLKTEFPCWRCGGKGYERFAVGPYDSDEENCSNCDATGKVSKEKFNSIFAVKRANYEEALERFKNNKKILIAAKKN